MNERIAALQKEAAVRNDVIGLSGGLPAEDLMPRQALGDALAFVATRRDEALQYGWPEGTRQLRSWIAARLASRRAAIDPERIIITAGAQQALSIAAGVLARASAIAGAERVTIETGDATYPGALDAFTRAGLRAVARGGHARYITAGVHMPRGTDVEVDLETMPTIVDEAYAELRFDGKLPRALLADAPDCVWHIGTISKTIAPGLRVGWLIPPEAHHDAALDLKSAADLHTASICQAAVAKLVKTIDYDDVVDRARAAYAERAAILVDALHRELPEWKFAEPRGGFSIWIETDDPRSEVDFLQAALDEGVMVDPGSLFRPEPKPGLALRVSYSNAKTDQLAEGIKRLARAARRRRS
jgi:2-aminoadipate transaminase